MDCRWSLIGCSHVIHDCLERLAYERRYSVSGICGELGLGERYLRELFVRDVGLTPKEWLHWERMVAARRFLMRGVDPLVVSELLGFSHPNSFRRAFRKVYGMAPLRFVESRSLSANPF
jgi:AraC-like DNA-binding protein